MHVQIKLSVGTTNKYECMFLEKHSQYCKRNPLFDFCCFPFCSETVLFDLDPGSH